MAIFAPLSIGRLALLANEQAIGVTGHNIANANTPGYSRQEVVFSPTLPDTKGFGTGVELSSVVRSVDGFLDARQLASTSALGGATTGQDLLDRLQGSFPVGDQGIGNVLAQFFAAVNGVANSPQDLAARSQLLQAGESLASQVRTAAGGIQTLQREADQRLGQAALEANADLQKVAQLNREIVAASRSGAATNDFLDERQTTLNDLAKHLSIQVVAGESGSVNVYAASGQGLVIGTDPATLTTAVDPAQVGLDGNPLSRLGIASGNGSVISLSGEVGGTIGTLLELRDTTLPGNGAALDQFATSLRDAVNAVQTNAAGRDLNGAVGASFFSGAGAADLQVAISDPRGIAAAQGSDPADNTNALALIDVANQAIPALGGATLSQHFGTIQSTVGQQAQSAADTATIQQDVASGLSAQREAVSGVSLDEEFTNLIRYQRGYQAAAQLITVSNTLLDSLLGLVS